jgi:hypothetical protein
VTGDGELTAAGTLVAARQLGIALPAGAGAAGMRAVPELARLWNLALGTGFTEVDAGAARAGSGEALGLWPEGTDDEVLDVWCAAFACVIDQLEAGAVLDASRSAGLDFMGAGTGLVLGLFLAREDGVLVPAACDAIQQDATAGLDMDEATEAWAAWTEAHGDPGAALLSWLAELGAVWLADSESPAVDPVARLTPLALWALREQLTAEGVEIPLLGPAG